jgi:hypothetical protein
VIVIVAHPSDDRAWTLAARWAEHDARVMTSRDLSTPGWSYRLDHEGTATTAVIDGRVAAAEDIAGVLTCVPAVTADELRHVVPEDRAYVAAEMTALMVAWLSCLECPVMNQPTPDSLMGPAWHPAQWLHAAGGLGISVRPLQRRVRRAAPAAPVAAESDLVPVVVVGDAAFGAADAASRDCARRLAAAAGVDLLTAYFADARLAAVEPAVDIARDDIADAILARFNGGRSC